MPQGEQGDVENKVARFVEEEDHAKQKQQVVVAGKHVLGAQIQKRPGRGAVQVLHIACILGGDVVTPGDGCGGHQQQDGNAAQS